MSTELIILLMLTAVILPGISTVPRGTFINAGPYLGARIEKQLDTGAGFQEIALDSKTQPLHWTDQER